MPSIAYDVYLDGEHIDTVWFSGYTTDEARRALIEHDGYDAGIEVRAPEPTPAASNVFDWKDGEYQYCADLVLHNGDDKVPANCLRSYLMTQMASAKRDERADVVDALRVLLNVWDGVKVPA